VRTEFLRTIPRCDYANKTDNKTECAKNQGMLHGPVGREPGRDVSAQHAIDGAVSRCQQQERIGHQPTQRRKDAGSVQHYIRANGERCAYDQSREHSENASTNSWLR
jgi:hypothetical protein